MPECIASVKIIILEKRIFLSSRLVNKAKNFFIHHYHSPMFHNNRNSFRKRNESSYIARQFAHCHLPTQLLHSLPRFRSVTQFPHMHIRSKFLEFFLGRKRQYLRHFSFSSRIHKFEYFHFLGYSISHPTIHHIHIRNAIHFHGHSFQLHTMR